MSTPSTPDFVLNLLPASQLVPRGIDWLWAGRLGLGKPAILDGDPGLGKSLVTLDLCARLSTGRPFPDNSPGPGPSTAIVLNGEDGAEDTIRPRLQALGADLERVLVLLRTTKDLREPLRFPRHTHQLAQVVARSRARLVVIDPIMAFLEPSVVLGSDVSVRQALFPLLQMAEEHRCALLMVRHLNKAGGFHSVYRGGGSIGIVGVCRSAWLVARDHQDPDRRILAQVKNNLTAAQASLAYTVQAPPGAPATLTWLGPSPWTADQLLAAAATAPRAIPARALARDFLGYVLGNGPRTSREIWASAQEQGHTKRTLRRAKMDMNIRSVRVWAGGKRLSYWLLPGQQLPKSVPPEARPPDLEEYLAPLREQFPPSTPLDDL
jgi:hypothetical protein